MPVKIRGAAEHNLQDIDVDFGDGLTVVTGVSGSGKTSLVFDTLYHEARRRFLEVYTSGEAAQRLAPAKVRAVEGLGPAMAVGQNLLNRNPNSILATASGLHPFLRLLYQNFGERRCARCGAAAAIASEDAILEQMLSQAGSGSLSVQAVLLRGALGSQLTLLDMLSRQFGAERVLVDGSAWDGAPLEAGKPHDLSVAVAQLDPKSDLAAARGALEGAKALGANALTLKGVAGEQTYARAPVCVRCGAWFPELRAVHFNQACPYCGGEGCPRCTGSGLPPHAAAALWQGLRLDELLALNVEEVQAVFAGSGLPEAAGRLQEEIARRLEALQAVGLGYLGLDRPAPTLSRGEAQRVRLALALTSRLEDMLHVLDEPTIGLHPADVSRLLRALRRLPGPVIYVEHDRLAAAAADRAIDLGPGAGTQGGRVVYAGSPGGLWASDAPTGRYLSLRERVAAPEQRPPPQGFLTVGGARLRNLQGFDAPIPLGRLTVITGVSGSGKSTLVEDVLAASLNEKQPIGCKSIEGPALKVVLVDQSPIGRNPRSTPATYTKLSEFIRELYAAQTGLSISHFSFNRPEGACTLCSGMGAVEVKLRYLPSTWILCEACEGRRYNDEVLTHRVAFGSQALAIDEFYDLSVAEARALFARVKGLADSRRRAAHRVLRALEDIGLGYLALGQPSPTLSGGEAQRVKLARYLGQRSLDKSLLVLDEPSTGLHAQDLAGVLAVLDRLVRAGGTVVIVEHNLDVIQAADWCLDLGPGAGPSGGRLLYAGPPQGLAEARESATGRALLAAAEARPAVDAQGPISRRPESIQIRGARAHNLQNVDVDFPRAALTVVTGVSGSGKSSLVSDVLEAEAQRRYLESLTMYERQGASEGPEAPVDSLTGLGVTLTVDPQRHKYDRRVTVGAVSEIAHHLAALFSVAGQRRCLECGAAMQREQSWICPSCGASAPLAEPRHFSPRTYAAACQTCQGVGALHQPAPEKLIVNPDKPLCGGAMHSPGFFPKGFLCKPYNSGYDALRALAARFDFDPEKTPWDEMSPAAQQAFLYGDPDPLEVAYHSRSGRVTTRRVPYAGFYGLILDWDRGGTYTDSVPCPGCGGARLRPEYLAVTLAGHNIAELNALPLSRLAELAGQIELSPRAAALAGSNLAVFRRRLGFLHRLGLGYLQLDRIAGTLSAGEAQRVKLAGLLGSGLAALTVLLDEPSRGLHPAEVSALRDVLLELRDEGNTVIVVEHDPLLIQAADHLIDLGPGAGVRGGQIVAQGPPSELAAGEGLTARWLRGERLTELAAESYRRTVRAPRGWLTIHGPRANNLNGDDVRLPLGLLVGVCGVSGSGKSTLILDTLGRALAPKKHTTSVAQEPLAPGEHDRISGAPGRAILVDQARAGLVSPASFLDLERPLRDLYAGSAEAHALGLSAEDLARGCSVCNGRGATRLDMGFLPDVIAPCETCRGSGFNPEAWEVRLRGLALPEVFARTIDQVYADFGDQDKLSRALAAARSVGLGYLVLRQPAYSLSGGEAQRLKIAAELARRTTGDSLYILDEPTVGLHLEDVGVLVGVLHRLVDAGRSVVVVEHHPHVLAACDWLVELGPGGGPDGGRVIASGAPAALAAGGSPIAPYLDEVLKVVSKKGGWAP